MKKGKINAKNVLFNLLLIFCTITMFVINTQSVTYSKEMRVININNTEITLQDKLTNNYITIQETNRTIGDKCIVTYCDNNTDYPEDDTIVSVKWID